MQSGRIIEKAKKLGINVSSGNSLEQLEEIALQLGIDGFNPTGDLSILEEALDNELGENQEESLYNDGVDTLDGGNYSEDGTYQEREKFGKREYDATKGEDGVHDKNYYAKKGEELDDKVKQAEDKKNQGQKEVKKKGENGEEISELRNKGMLDKAKDNIDLLKAKNDRFQNKINSAKSKAYQIMNPGEALKDKAKDVAKSAAKNVGKKAGAAAKEAGKAAGKAIASGAKAVASFIASNPWLIVVIAGVLIIIIVVLMGAASAGGDGYFDPACDFNNTKVVLTTCNTEDNTSMDLEDYVIGVTYSYLKDYEYNNAVIKALMIVAKTNALSLGNYSSSSKTVYLDDCSIPYTSDIDTSTYNKFTNVYEDISEELYLSKSYKSNITSLSSKDSLTLNQAVVDEMERLSSTLGYKGILNKIYNKNSLADEEDTVEVSNRQNIFVGDSRMAGMVNYGYISSSNSVYGTGMGYSWFVGSSSVSSGYNCSSNAISCVNNKVGSTPSNIIIWLGVNDINYYSSYYNKYYELATGAWKEHNIYIVSVGYLRDGASPYVYNSNIDTFNNYMKSKINSSGLSNLRYIDLGFDKNTMANGTSDGLHYGSSFSRTIYNKITEQVGNSVSISGKKEIYRLSDYCEFLYITENDYYWWPIGSSSPTQGSVIYGGSPTTTYVVSYFGMRIHPVYGDERMHYGIDIAADCGEVIIAAKSGTVTYVSDYDSSVGYGNYIKIKHDDGNETLYAHIAPNSIVVKVGDTVQQGQKIALIGTTGTSTGCHLHFEVRVNGSQVNPLNYVSGSNPRPVSVNLSLSVNDSVSGASETKAEICRSLLASGYSKNAVAGMLVNIQAEGGFRTNNLEDCYQTGNCCYNGSYGYCRYGYLIGNFGSDVAYTKGVDNGSYPRYNFVNDHAGYGLIQWTSSSRKAGLYDYAKKQGKSIGALSVQLGYLLKEIKDSYPTTYKYITGSYDAYTIAYYFCTDFERPANTYSTCSSRASNYYGSMLSYVNNGCK